MTWHAPVPFVLIPTDESESFRDMRPGATGLPLAPHPGAFAVVRRHHVHEGVDLYCPEGTEVRAVEPGAVVAIENFTGPKAGFPWWEDTLAVLVEGASGVVLYGEIAPRTGLAVGDALEAGDVVGTVKRVLRTDKGRPMAMLHLELHAPGTRASAEWRPDAPMPASLRDPTPFLLRLAASA